MVQQLIFFFIWTLYHSEPWEVSLTMNLQLGIYVFYVVYNITRALVFDHLCEKLTILGWSHPIIDPVFYDKGFQSLVDVGC